MKRSAVVLVATTLSTIVASSAAAQVAAVCVENATIGQLEEALAAGRTSSADLVRAYQARIAAFDRADRPSMRSAR